MMVSARPHGLSFRVLIPEWINDHMTVEQFIPPQKIQFNKPQAPLKVTLFVCTVIFWFVMFAHQPLLLSV